MYTYVCVYIYIYICMCVYIYIYIYMIFQGLDLGQKQSLENIGLRKIARFEISTGSPGLSIGSHWILKVGKA